MTLRFAPITTLLLPRLLAAIGAGTVLAAAGCGGKTNTASGEVANDVGGDDETSEAKGGDKDPTSGVTPVSPSATAPSPVSPPNGTPTNVKPPTNPPPGNPPPDSPPPTHNETDALDASVAQGSEGAVVDAAWNDRTESTNDDWAGSTPGSPDPMTTGESATSEAYECEFGQLERFCLTPEQMEQQARYGVGEIPKDPPRSDDEIAAGWDASQCMRPDWVATSCCNPGLGPGERQEDGQCCYVACGGVCCGRPFVVNGVAHVADVVARRDWLASEVATSTSVNVDFDPEARRKLAQVWLVDAQTEHASIASFNQFSLDLLRLGAPPDLVRDSQLAALDEIEHARHAFGVAARLSGEDSGPGLLEVGGVVAHSLVDAIAAAVAEGCIGETLAAAVVGEQARLCTDASLAKELERIAEDELRHAELAWRFVAWAVKQRGASAAAKAAFEVALARAVETPAELGLHAEQLHGAGRITTHEWRRVVDHTMATVIRPAAATLLGHEAPQTQPQSACV